MSEDQDAKIRDGRGRFVAGHAPLPDAGRPLGSVGSGRFRPLFDMMRQAVETDALIAAAEAQPSVEALLRRRRATADRVRRYRKRTKDGMRCARIRFTEPAIDALVELDFLQEGKCIDADYERAVYLMINAIRRAKLMA